MQDLVAARRNREWCLFLDRDGVLNRQVVGDYVRCWEDFEWLDGARDAIEVLSAWAPHLVVVTNQQGVGKGLMSMDDVDSIHHRLRADLPRGARIDEFMVCPHLESAICACRKPRPGLAMEWFGQHRSVDSSLSVVVGDSSSDVMLAHNLIALVGGCESVRVGTRDEEATFSFDSLREFATAVGQARAKECV